MKHQILLRNVLLSALLATSGLTWAEDSAVELTADKEDDYKPTYAGASFSAVQTGFDNLETAINLDVTLGLKIPGQDYFALEMDISQTLIPGENSGSGGSPIVNNGGNSGNNNNDGGLLGGLPGGGQSNESSSQQAKASTSSSSDFGLQSVALFATARSPGKWFGGAKVGYRYWQTSIPELNENRSALAWGLVAGYRYGKRSHKVVELYYTNMGDDVNYIGLSVGY